MAKTRGGGLQPWRIIAKILGIGKTARVAPSSRYSPNSSLNKKNYTVRHKPPVRSKTQNTKNPIANHYLQK